MSWVHSGSTTSDVPWVSSGGWSQAATLLADVNSPGSQEDMVSNWEPAHSLLEDAISGAKIAPPPPAIRLWLLPACLSASGLQIFCLKNQLIALLGFPYIWLFAFSCCLSNYLTFTILTGIGLLGSSCLELCFLDLDICFLLYSHDFIKYILPYFSLSPLSVPLYCKVNMFDFVSEFP